MNCNIYVDQNSIISVTSQQWWILSVGKLRKTFRVLSHAEDDGRRLDDEGKGFTIERVTETRTYLPAAVAQKVNKTFILPVRQ